MKNGIILLLLIMASLCGAFASQPVNNENFTDEQRLWLWWYWLGSSVTREGIDYHLDQFRKMGYGGTSIAATYGVNGNEANDIPFMSEKWVDMINYTARQAKARNMGTDVSLTSAWPFGGPNVTPAMAAQYSTGGRLFSARGGEGVRRQIFDASRVSVSAVSAYSGSGKYIDLTGFVSREGILEFRFPEGDWEVYGIFSAPTNQTTKRSGKGGEGLVLDHFNKASVIRYLTRYDSLFQNGTFIRGAFNDSYEVYGADYTPVFLEEFHARRGYRLEENLHHLFSAQPTDTYRRVLCDYRETISDLLLDNFVKPWSEWAKKHGVRTVEQAHGSPANWLDIYAAADVPETESFGASPLHIPGVRMDETYNEKSFGRPDKNVLKFASSASHIAGKKLTASESATWIGDHFKVALSQVKPQIDELFVCGVNHVMLTCGAYSPEEVPFPGRRFYPAGNFSPTSAFAPYLNDFSLYIARSQKILQESEPDNDVLLYVPIHDLWSECEDEDGRSKLMMFTVHNPDNWFYKNDLGFVARTLRESGFDFDYISDRQIADLKTGSGNIISSAGTAYKTIVIPNCRKMPPETLEKLKSLAEQGFDIIFAYRAPQDIPGYYNADARRVRFSELMRRMREISTVHVTADYISLLQSNGIRKESFGEHKLEYIRKRNENGIVYFVANQSNYFTRGWVELSEPVESAVIFDPVNGKRGAAKINGRSIYLQMAPGESCFIEMYNDNGTGPWEYFTEDMSVVIDGKWKVSFLEGNPIIPQTFTTEGVRSWTSAPDTMARYFSGTGQYETTFDIPASMSKRSQYTISLGDVREVADVWVNDIYAGRSWCVPFELRLDPGTLKTKGNKLKIVIRNLDANRMIWMDRNKMKWQNFFFVDVAYNNFSAAKWNFSPSGLLGPVILKCSK